MVPQLSMASRCQRKTDSALLRTRRSTLAGYIMKLRRFIAIPCQSLPVISSTKRRDSTSFATDLTRCRITNRHGCGLGSDKHDRMYRLASYTFHSHEYSTRGKSLLHLVPYRRPLNLAARWIAGIEERFPTYPTVLGHGIRDTALRLMRVGPRSAPTYNNQHTLAR